MDFIVADASTYVPNEYFGLIICFYIQLFPAQGARMLANVSKALPPEVRSFS